MDFLLQKPEYVMVKFQGVELWIEQDHFEFLQQGRRDGINDFHENTCVWQNGKFCRLGFYTLQNPTLLVEQGELCPTEVIAHMNDFALRKIGLVRDNILSEWRDPETKAEIEYFPY